MTESTDPPVTRIAGLAGQSRALAEQGLAAWKAGDLVVARVALESLRDRSTELGERDARFHALHLLGCVAFSEGRLDESRRLHEEVLGMSREIGFRGGAGSSLFDLARVAQAEGNVELAREQFVAARECFESGGYGERLGVVDAALEALPDGVGRGGGSA